MPRQKVKEGTSVFTDNQKKWKNCIRASVEFFKMWISMQNHGRVIPTYILLNRHIFMLDHFSRFLFALPSHAHGGHFLEKEKNAYAWINFYK